MLYKQENDTKLLGLIRMWNAGLLLPKLTSYIIVGQIHSYICIILRKVNFVQGR